MKTGDKEYTVGGKEVLLMENQWIKLVIVHPILLDIVQRKRILFALSGRPTILLWS